MVKDVHWSLVFITLLLYFHWHGSGLLCVHDLAHGVEDAGNARIASITKRKLLRQIW